MVMSGWVQMATIEERIVRVSWVLAASVVNRRDWGRYPELMKSIAPIWGSWKTWLDFSTDNVVCHDLDKSRELINKAFHAVCNFHVYREHHEQLGQPTRVQVYDGSYHVMIPDIEDVVSMHLAASRSDMVLLLGFDFARIMASSDTEQDKLMRDRKGLLRGVVTNTNVQWVAIDHDTVPDPAFTNLSNFTRDTMDNVLRLLTHKHHEITT